MSDYFPLKRRAIGSAYLVQKSPGGEQVGGLEIMVTSPSPEGGRITVQNTIYQSDEMHDDIECYTKEALRGVNFYAHDNDIDLSRFDVTLRRFMIHDVDSRPFLYFVAAQQALRSALAMWNPPSESH